MDYREIAPPDDLRHLVKAGWTLSVPADAPDWVRHVATPDGCLEVIRRLAGRSQWAGEQPELFIAGALTTPAQLRFGPGSRFIGLRLWPWTWRAVTRRSPAELIDRWESLDPREFPMPDALAPAFDLLRARAVDAPPPAFASALLGSSSCREVADRTGWSPRALQRWFERHVGQPPRTWLRLLRFSEALAGLPAAGGNLAAHAQDHGFADQAHMAREFRSLAGTSARSARTTAQGPFLGDGN